MGAIFYLANIITGSQALAGFSSNATSLVATMFMVAKALEESGVLEHIMRLMLGNDGLLVSHLRL